MLLRVEFVPILARFCHRKTDHPFFLATRERQKMLANAFSLIHSYCQILHGLAATAHYLIMKNISKMILYIRQWNSGSTKNEGYLCLLHAGVNDTATTTNFECGLPHSHLKRQIQNKELRMYRNKWEEGNFGKSYYRGYLSFMLTKLPSSPPIPHSVSSTPSRDDYEDRARLPLYVVSADNGRTEYQKSYYGEASFGLST